MIKKVKTTMMNNLNVILKYRPANLWFFSIRPSQS